MRQSKTQKVEVKECKELPYFNKWYQFYKKRFMLFLSIVLHDYYEKIDQSDLFFFYENYPRKKYHYREIFFFGLCSFIVTLWSAYRGWELKEIMLREGEETKNTLRTGTHWAQRTYRGKDTHRDKHRTETHERQKYMQSKDIRKGKRLTKNKDSTEDKDT